MRHLLASLVVPLAVLACSPAPTEPQRPQKPSETAPGPSDGPTCPELAETCPAGCFPVGASPVDRQRKCRLPQRTFGCTAVNAPGPPAVICSMGGPSNEMWISMEARGYPGGRQCTQAELDAIGGIDLPACP